MAGRYGVTTDSEGANWFTLDTAIEDKGNVISHGFVIFPKGSKSD
jgi:hypothetical protein